MKLAPQSLICPVAFIGEYGLFRNCDDEVGGTRTVSDRNVVEGDAEG